MTKRKCQRKGCERTDANWIPVLELYAPVRNTPPIEAVLADLPVCDEHAEPDPALWITDAGWEGLCAPIVRLGRMRPKRSKTRVKFYRPTSPKVAELLAHREATKPPEAL